MGVEFDILQTSTPKDGVDAAETREHEQTK